MCYSFFSLSFCSMPIGLQALEETYFTWSNPRWVSFQFNQEPSWLPIYRHLAFPRFVFVSPNHTRIQNTIGTERLRHHPQNIGVGHAIFLLFHPWNSNLKIEQLHGPANSSIKLLSLPSIQQQSANPLGWMTVLLSRQPTIFSKTETPKTIFPIPRKHRF